jgi:hypothetical protein
MGGGVAGCVAGDLAALLSRWPPGACLGADSPAIINQLRLRTTNYPPPPTSPPSYDDKGHFLSWDEPEIADLLGKKLKKLLPKRR